jgi:chemotaxis protein methyltransferase CheR
MKLKLSFEEFSKIRDFIYEKSGMFFADVKQYLLEDRIFRRMREINIDNVENYLYYLKYDLNKNEELLKLFDEVTTNETYFYRNLPVQTKERIY